MFKLRIRFRLVATAVLLPLCTLFITASLSAEPSPNLQLTEKERAWLKNNTSVTFTGDPNWLPYEAFDQHGNYIGIVSEHLELISQTTGLEFVMSPSETWTESTQKAKQGLVDILSETDDSDLKSHLDFTNPYLSNPIVIAMRSTENYVEGIDNIKDKKIALIKDYGYASKIRRKYPHIKFITVDDIQSGLLAVSTGEVDTLLCTLALCSYTIAELGLNNVRITGKTEFVTKLALGVQKNNAELLSILNKSIGLISRGQQQEILDRWIKQKFAEKIDYTLVYQILIAAAILIAIFIFWNLRLTREVELRKKAEEELRLYSLVLENSSEGMMITDADNKIVAINPAFTQITGFNFKDVVRKSPGLLRSGKHDRAFYQDMWHQLETEGYWQGEIWNKRKNGDSNAQWMTINVIYNNDKSVQRYIALFSDITEKKITEEMIWKQANFDVLTELPNRNMFHDRLEQEAIKCKRANLSLALLLIDLDQFKEVNDTLGHDIGDLLLQEAGARISNCVRSSDTVARLGGDEFIVILSHLESKTHVEDVAQKIIKLLAESYYIGDHVVHISGSIGITLFPNDTNDIDALIKNADQAMYAAKKLGRNRFSYFTQSLQDAAQYRLSLKNDLREALAKNQFEIHFQPIVNLHTGMIHKAEALLRWQHPVRGMVSPTEFISITEETGFINEIGDWVFKESSCWSKKWSNQFKRDIQITVNTSPVQFKVEGDKFGVTWLEHLNRLGLSGSNIVLEITENLLLHAEINIVEKLLWLRDAGIQVAIDDFGTGYSSLSYLKAFDIDYLKIDQIFVHNLETDANDFALCEAIVVMAHKLGLDVIAEGVETEAQRKILFDAGCDYAQGYLYSEPLAAAEFERLLSDQVASQFK